MLDLPIPNADPTQPETIQHFSIDPQTVSLMVQGDINFQLSGQQWFGLDGTFDAIFKVSAGGPVLDVLFDAYLVVGSTSAPLIELNTEGFLRISSGGVAGELLASADWPRASRRHWRPKGWTWHPRTPRPASQ